MKKFMYAAVTLFIVGVVFGTIFGIVEFTERATKVGYAAFVPPPVIVDTELARDEQWDNTLSAIGTIEAVSGVDITTEVGGLVHEIYFTSGQEVEAGAVLLQLDDRVEQANLKSYKAQLRLAQINYDRDKKLLRSNAISRTNFDKVEATLRDVQAQVERTEAIIAQKRIRAPFAGRLGIRQVNVGEFVNSGDDIVTLQAVDALLINFRVPEQYFPRLYVGQLLRFTVQAFGGRVFNAELSSINAKVDDKTRNILVQGSFNNPERELLPGMFANVDVVLDQQQPVVTVPQTAISYSLYGDSVFVVSEQALNIEPPNTKVKLLGLEVDLKELSGDAHFPEIPERGLVVSRRYIKVGQHQGGRVAIVEGIASGERVVTAGQLKLNNGTRVAFNNAADNASSNALNNSVEQ